MDIRAFCDTVLQRTTAPTCVETTALLTGVETTALLGVELLAT